jgi:3-hydroxyisobutyrate dehydrogenase
MGEQRIGFIGLGNMGQPMARHVADAGYEMICYDIAGTENRAPQGTICAQSVIEVATEASVILLSLPSVEADRQVVAAIAESGADSDTVVADTSTIGPAAARAAHETLSERAIDYVDAPISGLVFRAKEGTLTVMYSGSAPTLQRIRPVLEAFSVNIFHVGQQAGQGQLMKLVNNAIVLSNFVVTSEAVAYAVNSGIDMQTALEIINVSSGQNFVSTHIFPRYMLKERYDSGSTGSIIQKDLSLFVESAAADGASHEAIRAALEVVERFAAVDPDADQTEIYPFIKNRR